MLWQKNNYYEIIMVLILAVTATILNCLQITFTLKHQRNKNWTSSSVFILNVAMADLLVPITVVTYKTYDNLSTYFILTIGKQASVFLLLGLSFDRLYAVKKPMQYRVANIKTVVGFCILLWLICISIATITILVGAYADSIYQDFKDTVLPSIIFLGLVIIAVTYVCIYHKVSKHMGKMTNGNRIGKTNMSQIYKKKEKNLVLYSIFVFSSFAISWLPYAFARILTYFNVIRRTDNLATLKILFSFFLLNGIIDPFLYKLYVYKKAVSITEKIESTAHVQETIVD